MTITIGPELETKIQEKAKSEGLTVQAYVERLIREDEEWGQPLEEPIEESCPEFQEIQQAVMQGLEEAERGEGRPAHEAFSELRAKYGISS